MKRRTKKVLGLALTAFVGVGAIIPLASCYGPPMQESYLDTSPKDVMVKHIKLELEMKLTLEATDKVIISQNTEEYYDISSVSLVYDKTIPATEFVDNAYSTSGDYVIDKNKTPDINISVVKASGETIQLATVLVSIDGGYRITASLIE